MKAVGREELPSPNVVFGQGVARPLPRFRADAILRIVSEVPVAHENRESLVLGSEMTEEKAPDIVPSWPGPGFIPRMQVERIEMELTFRAGEPEAKDTAFPRTLELGEVSVLFDLMEARKELLSHNESHPVCPIYTMTPERAEAMGGGEDT